MPILETRAITGGVDTHPDKHVATALKSVGESLASRTPTNGLTTIGAS